MRRREFTVLAGTFLFRPTLARAQEAGGPVVGVLHTRSQTDTTDVVSDIRSGLREAGWVDGQNVVLEHRWADADYERLAALASDLVRQRVSLILTTSLVAARAAKAATSTTPIVFTIGDDPVKYGLVANLNRPGGNATGIAFMPVELSAKRLEVLHELVPDTTVMAALVNPTNPNLRSQSEALQAAARMLGVRFHVLCLRTSLRRSRTGLCFLRRETISRRRRRAGLRRGNRAPARSQRRKTSETAALNL